MRAVVVLTACLLALVGAASAGEYFEVTQTPALVSLQGVPLSDVRVKFTDEGKKVVENILSSLKVKVDGKEVQVTNVARKIAEVRQGNIVNEEYVVGALGYEVPEGKYFVGYLQAGNKKYVVRYDEEQKPVTKTAPGFGSFKATVVDVLGEYDEKGLPLVAPSIAPTEVKEEVLLCLPVTREITLKPAVLQMDWYKVLEKAELGKVFVKSAEVHAYSQGDKIKVVYAPTKADVLTLLLGGEEPLIPTQDAIVSAIVDPYVEEATHVVDAKIDEILQPIQEELKGTPLEFLVKNFLPTFLKKLASVEIAKVKDAVVSALVPYAQNVRAFLVTLYVSQYPSKVDLETLTTRKAVHDSPLYEPLVMSIKAACESGINAVMDALSNAVTRAIEPYAKTVAKLIGVKKSAVKDTVKKLTVGVLENLANKLSAYADYLIKLLALNLLVGLGALGLTL
ncbi:hypothetical protein [Methanopyrus sp.]